MHNVIHKSINCISKLHARRGNGAVIFAEGAQTTQTRHQELKGMTIDAQIFTNTGSLPQSWDSLDLPYDVFLSRPYMQVLERYAPVGMDFAYVLFSRGGQAIGRAYFQIKHFDAYQSIKTKSDEKEISFFSAFSRWVRTWVSKQVKSDVLVCGNLLCTGEHHFQFLQGLTDTEIHSCIEMSVQKISDSIQRKAPLFVLIKDILPKREAYRSALREKYTEFEIQPNMVLDIQWPDFDAYQAAMSTKYRTRLKRARKKRQDIERRSLDCLQMRNYQQRMYQLYESVASNVGFNMVDLNPGYLAGLCEALPNQFECFGYFLNEELVAFYTMIENGKELEAHFTGYDKRYNHDYQLYLNMLYDIVECGISLGKKRIIFARTALEIKSTVGAVPESLYCYLRHPGPITNLITPRLVEYLKPTEQWQQRHPFKSDATSGADDSQSF